MHFSRYIFQRHIIKINSVYQSFKELLRARESSIWNMEEMQIQEKHQVARSQLKDQFLLQKMLLIARHDKEMEQINRHNERLLKSLQERQRAEKIRLPKWQRSDGNSFLNSCSLLSKVIFLSS